MFGQIIWDTSKSLLFHTFMDEHEDRLRPLSYSDADVILMCFSVESPDSLDNISEKWLPEVQHFCPHVPIVLVGNKQVTKNVV